MGQSRLVCKSSKVSSSCDLKGRLSASSKLCSREEGLQPTIHSELRNMMEGDVTVESLALYMSPMANKEPLTHHFLIVEVKVRMKTKTWNGFIRAEKVVERVGIEEGVENGPKGGRLRLDWSDNFDAEGISRKFVYELEGCEKIPMRKLIDVLLEADSEYSVGINNCWKYADETYRRLIEKISNLPGTRSETRQNLQSYLAGIPALRLPGQAFCCNDLEVITIAEATIIPTFLVGGILLYGIVVAVGASTVPMPLPSSVLVPALGPDPVPLWLLCAAVKSIQSSPAGFSLLTSPHVVDAVSKTWKNWKNWPMDDGSFVKAKHIVPRVVGLRTAFHLTVAKPTFWLTLLLIAVGIFVSLCISWVFYKLIRSLRDNNDPDMNIWEWIWFLFKNFAYHGLKMMAQWIWSGPKGLFESLWFGLKGLFEQICSWFTPKPVTEKID